MVIKNKDGSIYKLSKPNPIVMTQKRIDKNIIVHNINNCETEFEKAIEKQTPKTNIIEENKKTKIITQIPKIFENKIEKVNEIEEKETIQEPPIEEKITIYEQAEEQPSEERNKSLDKQIIFHALPTQIVDVEYEGYGESYSTEEYSEKIQFAGVIINHDSLILSFWTRQELNKNSIVFPYKQKIFNELKDKFETKNLRYNEWWKVVETEEKTGGFIYSCIHSDLQPSFS